MADPLVSEIDAPGRVTTIVNIAAGSETSDVIPIILNSGSHLNPSFSSPLLSGTTSDSLPETDSNTSQDESGGDGCEADLSSPSPYSRKIPPREFSSLSESDVDGVVFFGSGESEQDAGSLPSISEAPYSAARSGIHDSVSELSTCQSFASELSESADIVSSRTVVGSGSATVQSNSATSDDLCETVTAISSSLQHIRVSPVLTELRIGDIKVGVAVPRKVKAEDVADNLANVCLESVFFCDFHATIGYRIVAQYPEGIVTKTSFDKIWYYLLSAKGDSVSILHEGMYFAGKQIFINSPSYPRNCYMSNVVLVTHKLAALPALEVAAQHLNSTLRHAELCTQWCSKASQTQLTDLVYSIYNGFRVSGCVSFVLGTHYEIHLALAIPQTRGETATLQSVPVCIKDRNGVITTDFVTQNVLNAVNDFDSCYALSCRLLIPESICIRAVNSLCNLGYLKCIPSIYYSDSFSLTDLFCDFVSSVAMYTHCLGYLRRHENDFTRKLGSRTSDLAALDDQLDANVDSFREQLYLRESVIASLSRISPEKSLQKLCELDIHRLPKELESEDSMYEHSNDAMRHRERDIDTFSATHRKFQYRLVQFALLKSIVVMCSRADLRAPDIPSAARFLIESSSDEER